MYVPELETKRQLLRPLALEDDAALYAIYSDPTAMRLWHTPPHRSIQETRSYIGALIDGSARPWAIVRRSGGPAIGLIYFLDDSRTPGLGYILAPALWRDGLMSEAVQAVIRYGFERWEIERIELWIDERNIASQKVAEGAGFRLRGAFRQKYPHATMPHETYVYGLRAEEWAPGQFSSRHKEIDTYSMVPVLPTLDVQRTMEYYRDKLGFRITLVLDEPPTYGAVSLGQWSVTGAHIRFSKNASPQTSGVALYLNVGAGVDELCETYRKAGVSVVDEPSTKPWGTREFAIMDCNGVVLRFGTPV